MRIVAAAVLAGVSFVGSVAQAQAPTLPWRLVREYPHDPASFTEGLALAGPGRLLESSGGYGKSELQLRDLASGRKLKGVKLPPGEFGEGAAIAGNRVMLLTWREGRGHVYDLGLKPQGGFTYIGEGWGLAWDGTRLLQTDGSAQLYFVEPRTFAETGHVTVHDGDTEIYQLNELEYANGRVYANVWQSDRIVVIAPETGAVLGWLDLSPLGKRFDKPGNWDPDDDVLNGIAFDPASGHFYVTGKRWPKLFEIELLPTAQP